MASDPRHIPDYIADQYGGRRGFKATKRAEIRAALKALGDLQCGAAYLPSGSAKVTAAREELLALLDECSARKWGR